MSRKPAAPDRAVGEWRDLIFEAVIENAVSALALSAFVERLQVQQREFELVSISLAISR